MMLLSWPLEDVDAPTHGVTLDVDIRSTVLYCIFKEANVLPKPLKEWLRNVPIESCIPGFNTGGIYLDGSDLTVICMYTAIISRRKVRGRRLDQVIYNLLF